MHSLALFLEREAVNVKAVIQPVTLLCRRRKHIQDMIAHTPTTLLKFGQRAKYFHCHKHCRFNAPSSDLGNVLQGSEGP
jgi:hypothetical protein